MACVRPGALGTASISYALALVSAPRGVGVEKVRAVIERRAALLARAVVLPTRGSRLKWGARPEGAARMRMSELARSEGGVMRMTSPARMARTHTHVRCRARIASCYGDLGLFRRSRTARLRSPANQ